jgi:hypothetical protein
MLNEQHIMACISIVGCKIPYELDALKWKKKKISLSVILFQCLEKLNLLVELTSHDLSVTWLWSVILIDLKYDSNCNGHEERND